MGRLDHFGAKDPSEDTLLRENESVGVRHPWVLTSGLLPRLCDLRLIPCPRCLVWRAMLMIPVGSLGILEITSAKYF